MRALRIGQVHDDRCINCLEEHDDGFIRVNGTEISGNLDDATRIRQEVGMVFQQFNLFPGIPAGSKS